LNNLMPHRLQATDTASAIVNRTLSILVIADYLPVIKMELPSEGHAARLMALSLFRFFIHQNRVSY
jgi:hypothetical protein